MVGNKQRGDTIVEVLLAMSVIGLVLGASFGIANRSVRLGQEAQERTEALKIAETQLEMLRSEYKIDATLKDRAAAFCFDTANNVADDGSDPCVQQNGSGGEGLYDITITPPPTDDDAYEIRVQWQQLGGRAGAELNNVRLYYKPGTL